MIKMITKKKRRNLAVSEIIGTILMLGISTISFSVVYYQVTTTPVPTPAPIVEISGTIDENSIVLTHRGGETLDLDSELLLSIGGNSKKMKVGDFLDDYSKKDKKWNLGEKIVYPIIYDFDYSEYPDIDIEVIDKGSNSYIMKGVVLVSPTCDLGVEMTVDDLKPREYENVVFTINVTNYSDINASGILIEFLLPDGLSFYSSTMTHGSYDSGIGIWDIGQLIAGESADLFVEATVGDVVGESDPTQLAILLDGSSSISPSSWTLMLNGLSAALSGTSRFPHSGDIELSVIQFGGKNPAFARLEIGPIIVTESNIDSIIEDIENIDQIGDKTPTSCAVYMAADVLKDSDMFDRDIRQLILLVTDGNPTHTCECDGDYEHDNGGTGPKDAVILARDYAVTLLELSEDQDEFNALAVELQGQGHNQELVDNVVWPQPGYYFPDDYNGGGWVRNVSSWEDFADSINESFGLFFNKIPVSVNIKSTAFSDPKEVNDQFELILKPIP